MKPMTEPEESTRLAISPKGAPGQVFGAGNPRGTSVLPQSEEPSVVKHSQMAKSSLSPVF